MFFNIPLSLAFQLAKIIPACAEYAHTFPNNFKLWITRLIFLYAFLGILY